MTENDELLERASEILDKYDIGGIVELLIEESFRFEPTQSIGFVKYQNVEDVDAELQKAVTVISDGHEIILGFSSFRPSAAPDDDTFYADAYVYFDKELVLQTGVTRDYGQYKDVIRVMTYPFSLKSFKAGPWLELVGSCCQKLVEDSQLREEKKRQAEVEKQVSNIDLGDY